LPKQDEAVIISGRIGISHPLVKIMQSALKLALSLIGLLCLGVQPCLSSDWKQSKASADSHEERLEFGDAAVDLERALQLCPQQNQDARLQLECQIIGDYVRGGQFEKAKPHADRAVALAKALTVQRGGLSGESLIAVGNSISELKCEPRSRSNAECRARFALATELAENIVPNRPDLPDVELDYAQVLVAGNQLTEGILQLQRVRDKFYKEPKQKEHADRLIAAVEERQGHPQPMQHVFNTAKAPKQERLRMVAGCELWVENLDRCVANATEALKLSCDSTPRDVRLQQDLMRMLYDANRDKGRYKEAESLARQRVAFLSEYDPKSGDRIGAAHNLREILRLQHRDKEAAAVKLPYSEGLDFFVTDDDKKEMVRAAQQRRDSP
jgi:hypothetical protein